MRRLACCVAFSSIVSFDQMTLAAGSSFSDVAKQVQTNQEACQQPEKSYDPSLIKKLSADYAAFYQAVALTNQRIDSNNPLAALAQDKMKQYQQVQNFVRDNALELISGSTYTNPDWLKLTRIQGESDAWTSTGNIFKWGVGGRFTHVYPAKDRNHYWRCLSSTTHAGACNPRSSSHRQRPSCPHSELEIRRSEAIQPFSYWQARLMLSDHNELERSRVAVQFGFGPEEPTTSSQGLSALAI